MNATRVIGGLTGLALVILMGGLPLRAANAVEVTIEAGDTELAVGETTTVTVYGRIAAAIESNSDRIFSWYVDVLNDAGGVAGGYGNLQTPAADNTPQTSSDGTTQGANRRGIYDTFLNRPGAGKGSRVILVQFEVTAQTPGTATFSVAPGTTAGPLTDFLVAKTGSGSYSGGNYASASVTITVSGTPSSGLGLQVTIVGNQANATFNPLGGYNHTVEWSPDLGVATPWAPLPGAPHNAGTASQDITGKDKVFYRVSYVPQ